MKAFDFTPRPPGRSYAAKGGLKEWPDEWVCRNCANARKHKRGALKVWCAYAGQQMWHNSDRACFEEPLDMKERRERLGIRDPHEYGA